jgi:hypothetical protein
MAINVQWCLPVASTTGRHLSFDTHLPPFQKKHFFLRSFASVARQLNEAHVNRQWPGNRPIASITGATTWPLITILRCMMRNRPTRLCLTARSRAAYCRWCVSAAGFTSWTIACTVFRRGMARLRRATAFATRNPMIALENHNLMRKSMSVIQPNSSAMPPATAAAAEIGPSRAYASPVPQIRLRGQDFFEKLHVRGSRCLLAGNAQLRRMTFE